MSSSLTDFKSPGCLEVWMRAHLASPVPHATRDPLLRSDDKTERVKLLVEEICNLSEVERAALIELYELGSYCNLALDQPAEMHSAWVSSWFWKASWQSSFYAQRVVLDAGLNDELLDAIIAAGLLDNYTYDKNDPAEDLIDIVSENSDFWDIPFLALLGVVTAGLLPPEHTDALLAGWRLMLAVAAPDDDLTDYQLVAHSFPRAAGVQELFDAVPTLSPEQLSVLAGIWKQVPVKRWTKVWTEAGAGNGHPALRAEWVELLRVWHQAGHPLAGDRDAEHCGALDAVWSALVGLTMSSELSTKDAAVLTETWQQALAAA